MQTGILSKRQHFKAKKVEDGSSFRIHDQFLHLCISINKCTQDMLSFGAWNHAHDPLVVKFQFVNKLMRVIAMYKKGN